MKEEAQVRTQVRARTRAPRSDCAGATAVIPVMVALASLALIVVCELGIHRAATQPNQQMLGLVMVSTPLLLLALIAAARSSRRLGWLVLWVLSGVALWCLREPLMRYFEWAAYLKHVGFNLFMAYIFGRTLSAERQPLCSRLAAAAHGVLTPAIATYTRRLTLVWMWFFIVIAVLSTVLFVLAPLATWATFANYLSLPLIGLLFVVESGWRRATVPGAGRLGMMAALRGAWSAAREE